MPAIYVFNRLPIGQYSPDEIRAAVTESNFHTLCKQYGLDPALIEPAKANLNIQVAAQDVAPFFTLHYNLPPDAPIIVNCWKERERVSEFIRICTSIAPEAAQSQVIQACEVFKIELRRDQSHDLGLLFAYELARWAAFRGEGVVRALDGLWYRLNPHKAFLLID